MSWTQRFASFCLAALFICGGAQAQPDIGNGNNGNSAAAAAAAPAPTIAELRAQFTKLSNAAETDDDARKLLAQINDIGVQADKFVAAFALDFGVFLQGGRGKGVADFDH